jgi:hypothetical protein
VAAAAKEVTGAPPIRPGRGPAEHRRPCRRGPARPPRPGPALAALLVWLAAIAAAGAATAERLVAEGACRDGVPNGAYALRMADGTPRAVGAFAKGRRTGTFVFWGPTGARVAVIPYEDDVKVGTVALWYAPVASAGAPRHKLESPYAAGLRHGTTLSWYANGTPRAAYRYEHGELAEARAWSETGEPLPEAAARSLAERDRASDAEFFAALEQTIAEHLPRCR